MTVKVPITGDQISDVELRRPARALPAIPDLPSDKKPKKRQILKWFVLGGSFLNNVIVTGIAFSFGIIYVELLDEFQEAKGATAAIGSINIGIMFGIGPLAGFLTNRFGARVVTIAGSILSSTGLLVTAFTTSLGQLYGTYGVLAGMGFGFINLTAVISVNQHFGKKRGLASAISVSGCGIGSLLFPIILSTLIDRYGWRQTMLVISGVQLLTAVSGAIMVPKPVKTKKIVLSEKDSLKDTDSNNSEEEVPKKTMCKFSLDLKVFRNVSFTLFFISCVLSATGAGVPSIIISDYARSKDASASQAALLISIIGIAGTVGRIFAGIVSTMDNVDNMITYIINMILSGVGTALYPLNDSYWLMIMCSVYFGLFYGVAAGFDPVIIADIVGVEQLAMAYGYFSVALGLGSIISSPLAGSLRDVTGDYDISFYLAGALMVAAGVFLTILPIRRYRQKKSYKLKNCEIYHVDKVRPISWSSTSELSQPIKEDRTTGVSNLNDLLSHIYD